ncbi:MAG: hypothetical protein IPM82_26815 [Saprospiraceae bacterium]|nr:hypothetical protein [Saprospiraceae bacterium]
MRTVRQRAGRFEPADGGRAELQLQAGLAGRHDRTRRRLRVRLPFHPQPRPVRTLQKADGAGRLGHQFLQLHSNMEEFLNQVYLLTDPAIENYIERSFTDLSFHFGCTGGQHRSVYAADQLAKHIQEKYGVKVALHHREQELKRWKN